MNGEQRAKLAKMRRALSEAGITQKRKFIHITCDRCGRYWAIRVNDKKNWAQVTAWVCPVCK